MDYENICCYMCGADIEVPETSLRITNEFNEREWVCSPECKKFWREEERERAEYLYPELRDY